ncbi:hypothetical protein GCM10022221_29120 [Actinocorallia aurea]
MPAKTVIAIALAAATAAGMSGTSFADDAVRAPGAVRATETPSPTEPEATMSPSAPFTAPDVTAEQAISKAMDKVQDSKVASASLEGEEGSQSWDILVLDKDGKWQTVMVDATSGDVTGPKAASSETTAKMSTAVKDAKITATDAITKATEKQPGTVKELKFHEKDGKGAWMVEVVDDQGAEHEVVVDATSGEAVMKPTESPTMSPTESPASPMPTP